VSRWVYRILQGLSDVAYVESAVTEDVYSSYHFNHYITLLDLFISDTHPRTIHTPHVHCTNPVLTRTPYFHRVAAVFPGVQWIQTSSPSAMVDSRTINTSISLVAVTFGYQTIEFQEKAIQFFSQTLLPMFAKQQRLGGKSCISCAVLCCAVLC
jgi:hypothetical protein